MTLTEEIGAKIKYYRKKRGMKIVELAALLHKTGATVSKYESGQIAMDVVTLYEVAAALGVPRSQVELLHGASARQKVLGVRFDDAAALAAAQAQIAQWLAGGADGQSGGY